LALAKLADKTEVTPIYEMASVDLHHAARTGMLDAVPAKAFADQQLRTRNASGTTPLHALARYGGLERLSAATMT
jgi:hypothetical protein